VNSAARWKAVLGSASRHEYHGLLEYIPREQLTNIGKERLGYGAHGAVYPATWSRPSGLLCEEALDCESKEVVLKQVYNDGTSRGRDALFNEVS
jgi:hypothetical protein